MSKTKESLPLYDQKYFKVMAEEYSHLSYQYVFDVISSVLDKHTTNNETVLDLGCGLGWLVHRLVEKGCTAYGIDFAIEGVKIAKATTRQADFLNSDASRIPFREEAFDMITCTWLLEHVENPKKILDEIYRVLKKGGRAIVMSPSGELIHTLQKAPSFAALEEFGEEHFWEFSPYGLQELLQQTGFTIMERRGIYRFHFLNLFTFPMIKLFSPIRERVLNEDDQASVNEHTPNEALTKVTKDLDMQTSRFFIDTVLRGVFKVFLTLEKRLGNKPLFNAFGIETLFVCQKPA